MLINLLNLILDWKIAWKSNISNKTRNAYSTTKQAQIDQEKSNIRERCFEGDYTNT